MCRTASTDVMSSAKPKAIFRKDYKPVDYNVDAVHMTFKLDEEFTLVTTEQKMVPANPGADLMLNRGKNVALRILQVDGKDVPQDHFELTEKFLVIKAAALPQKPFTLKTEVLIKPQDNTDLEGLYKSSGNFCTQCEAEGFRNITFFQDRPDVMATYEVRMEADKAKYPVLLSNGNLVSQGDLEGGRHFAVWRDPYRKPCYLFALVAGDLGKVEDKYVTKGGTNVRLCIYAQHHNIHKCGHAMESLKKAMKWDEDRFGLEYDLDIFNIVAVDDFNMGAMENKSLNVFNSRLVLASPETATDFDFYRIEGVIGHEYFHNWTGNRVTCRDWFQLTLKEGLTVFRDQEFSADLNSRPVKRIEDVATLRMRQFAEDAGPMAHPIQPESYIQMNNFYTVTVYEKGAEVVRLYQTLLGVDGFRRGMDEYFRRHDGQAVTCDDFRNAMAAANNVDLSHMERWYLQGGTPNLEVSCEYNESTKTFKLHCKQSTPPTPGQPTKEPVPIPIAVGLLGKDGHDLPLTLEGASAPAGTTTVLLLDGAEKTFTFVNVPERPVPSLLRGFSAPVKLTVEGQTDADLLHMMGHDSDEFNRWEAGQRLTKKALLALYEAVTTHRDMAPEDAMAQAGAVSDAMVEAFRATLTASNLDPAFRADALVLPAPNELVDAIPDADPIAVHTVRSWVGKLLAQRLRPDLERVLRGFDAEPGAPYAFNAAEMGKRKIKNVCLAYLAKLGDPKVLDDCHARFRAATNMTDAMAAIAALNDSPGLQREQALGEFADKWREESLVMLKWLSLCASSNVPGNLKAVDALLAHPSFSIKNPNCCYSLLGAFASSPVNFHNEDGSGYRWLADRVIQLNGINAQVAARVLNPFVRWRKYDSKRQALMRAELERIAATPGLCDDVFEIVSKSLEAA